MSNTVHVGALAPQALVLDFVPSDLIADLTTVTGAVIDIKKPSGTVVTWSAALSLQTVETLRISHPYVAGDIAAPGNYVARARLTTASATVICEPKLFIAVDEFAVVETFCE